MPGLEIHTLNQDIARELPVQLAARAGAIAAGSAAPLGYKAPESSGAFLIESSESMQPDGSVIDSSPAVSVIGDYLPSIETALKDFEALQDSDLVGDLMRRSRISLLTGCIEPDLTPNHKGYMKTGIKAVKELGLGTTSREAHRVVHFARIAEATGELPTEEEKDEQVDHECRNQKCIYHTRSLKPDLNNALMARARKVEPKLTSGQGFYATDLLEKLPWLTFALFDEGGQPLKVISTPLGPFALRLAHPNEFLVYGERVKCDVYDSSKPRAKKPSRRKSRAKSKAYIPMDGEVPLFAA